MKSPKYSNGTLSYSTWGQHAGDRHDARYEVVHICRTGCRASQQGLDVTGQNRQRAPEGLETLPHYFNEGVHNVLVAFEENPLPNPERCHEARVVKNREVR